MILDLNWFSFGQIVRLCFSIVDRCPSTIVSWAGFSARASRGQSSGADDHKSALKSGREGQFLDLVQRGPIM